MLDQLAGIIWEAAKCLCGRANEEVSYINDLEENLRSLKDKWEELQRKRQDLQTRVDEAEYTREMQRTQEVDGWMKKVDAIQEGIEVIEVQGDQEVQNKCLSKCCPKNCMSSYKSGKDVVEILKNVNELITKGENFASKDVEIAHKLPPRPIEMPLDKTIGLDWMFDKVWNSIEEDNVGVIGLYGMGGVGKTTLLKRVNNELRKKMSDFDVVIWVVVSKDPNLDSIIDNIRKLIGVRDDFWNHCSLREQKVAKIYEVLKGKKFVLLLDDIWQILDLYKVGVPHPKDTNFQSKVLFTTRLEDVCAKMQAQKTFKVEILREKEALELFCMKVGEETLKAHPIIPKLAKDMARECKGLPLALTVVGIAMAGVKSVETWKYSKNYLTSSPQTAPNLEMEVFSILKFSYDQLPDDTHKNCFLYCALYPEDYEISVLGLIDKWMANGFLDKEVAKSIQDICGHGEAVIEKLKQSCLLESVEDDLFMSRTVKMHDVIRDMALWLARDQDKNKKKILVEGDALAVSQDDVETWKIVERISVMQHSELYIPATPCLNLKSLTLKSNVQYSIMANLSNSQYMSKLKVLDLSLDTEISLKLPPEIGSLIFLEYLSFMGETWFLELPIELKNLENLKFFTLDVYCDLVTIPLEVISSLKQLRVLRILAPYADVSEEEREFLKKLESLPKLEALCISIKTKDGLKKLLESTKLQSCMHYLFLLKVDTPINMPSLLASLLRMKYLCQISLQGLANIVEDSSIFATCYLNMLHKVHIANCYSIVHLTWLKYAPCLQDLGIFDCWSLEEVIKEGTEDNGENEENIFSSLVRLDLWQLPKLKSIYKKALLFPKLKVVQIIGCPSLKKLSFDSNAVMEKLRHIIGEEEWWNELEWEDPGNKHKFHSVFQPF